jgi:DNA invertase Pin-like site-specific DNA recombinase
MSKIEKGHLERAAYIYVRQSTLSQVEHNLESQRRQYALVERAKELGWQEIRVVDEDMGRSGSGHVEREGFEALLAEVCQGQVGGVFAVEASRLARNGHEWHRLLEFCGIVDTLIVDHDGIYDPKHPNDRLVLGLKGTMSEMEVSMFRQRSQEAIRQKARRGEYYTRVAEGYVLLDERRLEKDPDERVRAAMELLFERFRELGSARQVHLWFHQEDIKLPRRLGKASGVEFVPATPWLVIRLLKDPTYAGAYAFGRTKRQVTLENRRKRIERRYVSSPEEWEVLIQSHHEGYLSWSEYLKNLETLAHNRNQLGEAVRGAARRGRGLLAGLVRCGHCGKKMQVRYGGGRGRDSGAVYYQCRASQRERLGKQLCSIFGGVTVENAVVEAVLESLSRVRMEALVHARERLTRARTEKRQQLELELERARYEADRCRRQYDAVEPENRQVARNLERRWDEALERVNQLNEELSQFDTAEPPMTPEEEDALRRLAYDLPQLWQHDAAPFDLKKRIVRTVIKEIVVFVEEKTLRVLVHWHGGEHSELNLRKRNNGEHRWKTTESTLSLIEQLARVMSDKQIAAQLNRMGIKSAKGHTWTRIRVGNFRKSNNILGMGSLNPFSISEPRCSNSKPFPATNWRTTSATNTFPGCARSQRRRASCTEVPKRSSPSVMGSPAFTPIRTLIASSGFALFRSANIFWICSAHPPALEAEKNDAIIPSPVCLISFPL